MWTAGQVQLCCFLLLLLLLGQSELPRQGHYLRAVGALGALRRWNYWELEQGTMEGGGGLGFRANICAREVTTWMI